MIRQCRRYVRFIVIGLGATALVAFFSGHADSQKYRDFKVSPPLPKDGTKVQWEGWTFNWSLRTVEGLTLSDVYFQGRKVLNYAGLAELFTAYDLGARPLDFNQNGLGEPRLPIVPGLDCSSGEWCKVFDAKGNEITKGGVPMVMMHEEKTGPNYLGKLGHAPGKTLVLLAAGHFAGGHDGYTFVVRWKFRSDGALIPEVGASGVPQHLRTGDTSPTGNFIGYNQAKEKVFAPSHVHNYLFRLDFAIDGEENTVEEFNWEKDKTNPVNAHYTWTPILKETGRSCNPKSFRSWRVVNYKSRNALGHPRSYHLIPSNSAIFRGLPSEKAAHADLWVTLYKPNEFPRSEVDSRMAIEALPSYADGESVHNKHVVVWYWLGFHHLSRSEDWMQQPMTWKSFELMPRDFLDGSPLKAIK
jgi:primary-amine oxidase